ncbi:GntR family transcriptional regulator [Pikeienuella sp. HZG-20]|uniref:GntR family transcriptional regulator n=1 Tax=Paludibacillus litoralis TaxID=3133267 RepID=UPI0030EE0519
MDLHVERETASLRSQIERNIRKAILVGRFKPGDRLIERELCELLGAGRASIREALRQLEAEGIIVNQRYRGPFVAVITADEARQLYEIREFLERIAVRDFTRTASAALLEQLGRALVNLERESEDGSVIEVVEAAGAFYAIIADNCGNNIVRQLLTQLYNRITILRATSMSSPDRPASSLGEIRDLYEKIRARDETAATEAAAVHVRNAGRIAIEVLSGRDAG